MAASAKTANGGFWRGFVLGLAVAAVGLLALALAYPPVPATPPEIDPVAAQGPAVPDAPALGTAPEPDAGPAATAPGQLAAQPSETASQPRPPSLAPVVQPEPDAPQSPSLLPAAPAQNPSAPEPAR